jgi:hypothetical protein
MRRAVERFIGFALPGLLNAGLALWILWHLPSRAGYARGIGFGAFVWLYAIAGLAILLSCASAFLLLASEAHGGRASTRQRQWLMLALVNTTIPSVLMLFLVFFR